MIFQVGLRRYHPKNKCNEGIVARRIGKRSSNWGRVGVEWKNLIGKCVGLEARMSGVMANALSAHEPLKIWMS
jgi:hypothetical protein